MRILGLVAFALLGCSENPSKTKPLDSQSLADAATDAAPDAEPDAAADPADAWSPPPAPWAAYPAHPFREVLDAAPYRAVAVLPGGLVVASSANQVVVLDPDRPGDAPLARLELAAEIWDFKVTADGRLAAVAAHDLVLIDLTSPLQPRVLGNFPVEGGLAGLALSPDGERLLIAHDGSVQLIDVRAPEAPVMEGAVELAGAQKLAFAPSGRTAAAGTHEGLALLDLSGDAPAVTAQLAHPGGIQAVAISGDGATLFAGRDRSIFAFDIADARAPELLGVWEDERAGFIHALTPCADQHALCVTLDQALVVLELGDRFPTVRGRYEVPAAALGCTPLDGQRVAVATFAGLRVIDLRAPGHPVLAGQVEVPPEARWWRPADIQITPDGRTAYLAHENGLAIIDVADPHHPRLAPTPEARAEVVSLALADGPTLMALSTSALEIFDVSAPTTPERVGTYDRRGQGDSTLSMDIAVTADGHTAFVVTEAGGGLDILDLSTPAAPTALSHTYIRHTRSVLLAPDEATIYVVDPYENGLLVMDVRDPTAPMTLGRLPEILDELALSPDRTLLAATGDRGLVLVDVRVPEAPTVVASLPLVSPKGDVAFSADGRTVLVANGPGGLVQVDLADPTAPRLVAMVDTAGEPVDLALAPDGRTVLLSSGPTVDLVALPPPPTLVPDGPPTRGVQRYTLRWTRPDPDHPDQLAWHVSAGTVAVTALDQTAGQATLEWTLPPASADVQTLAVAVGSYHAYQVAYAPPLE